ncbi:hypothetical protein GCM10011348_01280 [Marinobacterium nitratireducens]|uniref:Purine nucleoside phosphorylase n=1 Tax=Marinobacterium nitratireducens TaxID=518897 RepID=A0A917Z8E6_9GAMM|nr:DUF523 domain-containing protein [Marinobacterium nitratireducens]GGO75748.1 hypothetical protein GCM10011348_01280 [Marinobacterium nitratireducens]
MRKILISACLLGDRVRYDGGHSLLDHPIIARWRREGRLVALCPETAGGLPTPRAAAEIHQRFPILVRSRSGDDVTPAFLDGAERALEAARREGCICALMKANSPSCSNSRVYDGNFNNTLTEGPGLAAAELMRHGIPVFDETQLAELIDFIDSQEVRAA